MADPNYLAITPDNMGVGIIPDESGQMRVMATMDYDAKDAPWLAPDIRLAINMSPAEARSFAEALIRMADKAEAE